jgi:hypothetical protein
MKRYGLRDDQFSRIEALMPAASRYGRSVPGDGDERTQTHFTINLRANMGYRFGPPVTVNPPKNIGAKAAPVTPTVRRGVRQRPKKNPPA